MSYPINYKNLNELLKNMRQCPKCGKELKDGQKFCRNCGTPVVAKSQPASPNQQTNVCAKCGNPLKPGQKFCMKCGTRVTNVQNPAPNAQQSNQKGWFTDGVRAVANAVTGGALNREQFI